MPEFLEKLDKRWIDFSTHTLLKTRSSRKMNRGREYVNNIQQSRLRPVWRPHVGTSEAGAGGGSGGVEGRPPGTRVTVGEAPGRPPLPWQASAGGWGGGAWGHPRSSALRSGPSPSLFLEQKVLVGTQCCLCRCSPRLPLDSSSLPLLGA